jgi:all-trans-8'-apo-beta-carotenal 15,15'-oxygenase
MSHDTQRIESWNTALTANPGNIDLHVSTENIVGTIPTSLRGGRLLSNGPGWNQYGDINLHPFDGHGYLRSFSFNQDGTLSVKARFVETESYVLEKKTDTFTVRGFATNPHDQFWKNIGYTIPRNVANTTIYRWGNKLIAGWEGGEPHAVDPNTLETIGVETFNDVIADKITLAHMHHDPDTDALIVVNIKMGRFTDLEIHEMDSTYKCIHSRTATIPHTAFVHDFTFSKNWTIFGGNNLSIKPISFLKQLMGAGSMLTSIKTNTSADGELILIPRHSTEDIRRIRLPKPIYVVHFVNAFEEDDGTLIVDACIFHDFPFGEEFGYTGKHTPFDPALPDQREAQRMYRITIPPDSDEGSWEMLTPYGIDFPRVPPTECGQNARFMVGATRSDKIHSDPFDSIIVVDLQNPNYPTQVWSTSDTIFVGEPIIASTPTGDEHILVLLSDGSKQQTTLAIFEASNVNSGPACTIPMPLLPIAFHGEWDPIGVSEPDLMSAE